MWADGLWRDLGTAYSVANVGTIPTTVGHVASTGEYHDVIILLTKAEAHVLDGPW